MRKKRNLLHRVLRRADLPQDIDPHLLAIRWIAGAELLIEQHRGILRFQSDMIRFSSEQGVLVVTGNGLLMERLTEWTALITGEIRSVSFEDKS